MNKDSVAAEKVEEMRNFSRRWVKGRTGATCFQWIPRGPPHAWERVWSCDTC